MKSKTNTRSIAIRPTTPIPDTAAVQAAIERRLADKWGVPLHMAAVYSGLAGIGPQAREART